MNSYWKTNGLLYIHYVATVTLENTSASHSAQNATHHSTQAEARLKNGTMNQMNSPTIWGSTSTRYDIAFYPSGSADLTLPALQWSSTNLWHSLWVLEAHRK